MRVRDLLEEVQWRDHTFTLVRLAGAMIILGASLWYYFDRKSELNNTKAAYDGQLFANDEAELFRYMLQEDLPSYRHRQSLGYIGEPQRLQWVETLRALGSSYNIPGIEFTLESTAATEENVDPYWHPELSVMVTPMKITMRLGHEGDLYRMFNSLSDNAKGLYSVEECKLRWLDTYSEGFEFSRLRGDCELLWYTVQDITSRWNTP